MYIRTRLFRDAGTDGGGGNLTLAQVLGGGAEKIQDITEIKPDETPKPEGEEKPDEKPDDSGEQAEGGDDDGAAPKEDAADDGTDGEESDSTGFEEFWSEVGKITGREVKVEYPEGVEPQSPQGVAHRINVERDQAQQEMDAFIQNKYPRAYALMLHQDNGGTEDTFWNSGVSAFTLPTQEAMAASADLKAAVYKHDLISKGLSEEDAQGMVDTAIAKNKLDERSNAAYKNIDDAQKKDLENMQAQRAKEETEFASAVTAFNASVDKTIGQMTFIVPEAVQPEFKKYIRDRIQYDGTSKGFVFVNPLGDDLKVALEAMFFQYKKGGSEDHCPKTGSD